MHGANTTETINDLLQVVRDGRDFYQWAGQQPVDSELRGVFHDLETSKAAMIGELSRIVAQHGERPATSGTFAGGTRELYARVRAGLTSDKQEVLVAELEEGEDRILEAFRDALAEAGDNIELRQILSRYLPQVQASHDRMKRLKELQPSTSGNRRYGT